MLETWPDCPNCGEKFSATIDTDDKVQQLCNLCMAKYFEKSHFIEAVNHPTHYQSKKSLEVIDVIEAFDLDFHLGNAVKYILRSGKKGNEAEDLQKAIWYLQRHINEISKP